MKILHIITGLNNGGTEGVLYRLSTFDIQNGNEHIVVSLMGRGIYADRLERAGVAVYCMNMPQGKITVGGLVHLHQTIKRIKPNIIQTWLYHANLIGGVTARIAGMHAIAWGIRQANMDSANNKRSTLWVSSICAKLSRFVPIKIVSCSAKAIEVHKALGYQADKFVEIPNGYSLDSLKPNITARIALRDDLGIPVDTFVLGMVARFDIQKDHSNFLSALALLRKSTTGNFVCLLIGDGMELNNKPLTDLINKAGIFDCVKLLGPRSDIPDVMNALDLHVLSSVGEAFPNVLAEAMACGTPCVTTDVGDAALIVGSCGWVVAAQDPEALCNAIHVAKSQYSDTVSWKARQAASRKHIMENFELSQMVKSYRKIWQECIELAEH